MPDPADPIIERAAAELRRHAALGADFDARVMAGVRRSPPSALAAAWTWLREPRAVAVSPLGGLALAAAMAGLILVGALSSRTQAVATSGSRDEAVLSRTVTFVLLAPSAHAVTLAGDFNDWDPARTPLARDASGGLWTVDIPLAPGRYTYSFVVDGRRFVADPAAPRVVGDDFGTPTSVVTVGATAAGGSL
jgi:hypothetical protein